MRETMANDPFYKRCCLEVMGGCEGTIQWHHNLIFAGRQVNEIFCILPLCYKHHRDANIKKVRDLLDIIMLDRATPEQVQKYSKAVDYKKIKERLMKRYHL